jgi:hypothetical protein
MTTLVRTEIIPEPVDVKVTKNTLCVELSDGRAISVPTIWFPRLTHGTPKERANFELGHFGVHWPDLDEDISIEGLLRGEKSGESSRSLQRWMDYRARGEKVPVPTFPLPKSMARALEREKSRQRSRGRKH